MNGNYEEVEYIEIETPPCWGYMDLKDQSCQRCKIKEYCGDEQEATRPGCYGLLQDESNEECARCLDESQCVEYQLLLKQGDETMTKTTTVRRKRPARRKPPVAEAKEAKKAAPAEKPRRGRRKAKPVAKPAPQPEPVAEVESDYDEWGMRELREELKDRELATQGNKAKLIMRLLADDNAEDSDDEPEPEPAPKATRRGRRKAEAVPEPEEEEVDDGPGLDVEGAMAEFIESVGVGQSIVATRIDDDTWQFTVSTGGASVVKATGRGLRGKAYAEEVLTEEFLHFDNVDAAESGKSWRDMTVEEREELAAEFDVEIDEDRPKVRAMKLKPALMAALGIEKYKDEYKSRAARKALKDGV